MQGVLDRNKMVVLVLMVTELTFFWNHVGVILVNISIPHNTVLLLAMKFHRMWEKFLMLRQQRLLVGRN